MRSIQFATADPSAANPQRKEKLFCILGTAFKSLNNVSDDSFRMSKVFHCLKGRKLFQPKIINSQSHSFQFSKTYSEYLFYIIGQFRSTLEIFH